MATFNSMANYTGDNEFDVIMKYSEDRWMWNLEVMLISIGALGLIVMSNGISIFKLGINLIRNASYSGSQQAKKELADVYVKEGLASRYFGKPPDSGVDYLACTNEELAEACRRMSGCHEEGRFERLLYTVKLRVEAMKHELF